MRASAILLAFLLASALRAEAPFDQALRYVNDEVITVSDIRFLTGERLQEFQRRGKVIPQTDAEMLAFMQGSLEQLTDEALLAQKAKEMKLVPDHDRIVMQVLERAKELGAGLSLRAQAQARKDLERHQSIEYLLNYYYDIRTPELTPAVLWSSYQARQGEFKRPARARILQIILRPSDPRAGDELRRAKADLLKRAQDVADPALAEIAKARLADYLADTATLAEHERILDDLIRAFADAEERADRDAASAAMVRDARDLRAKAGTIRDLPQTMQALEAVRASLEGTGEDGFRASARAISQGPNPEEGGEQWIEPGDRPQAFDEQVFAIAPTTLSQVFQANQAACLVYLIEREDARMRSFSEVAGELEAGLRRERREAMRQRAVDILRAKASIRDLVPLASLMN
jgi:hypothetical protein